MLLVFCLLFCLQTMSHFRTTPRPEHKTLFGFPQFYAGLSIYLYICSYFLFSKRAFILVYSAYRYSTAVRCYITSQLSALVHVLQRHWSLSNVVWVSVSAMNSKTLLTHRSYSIIANWRWLCKNPSLPPVRQKKNCSQLFRIMLVAVHGSFSCSLTFYLRYRHKFLVKR